MGKEPISKHQPWKVFRVQKNEEAPPDESIKQIGKQYPKYQRVESWAG